MTLVHAMYIQTPSHANPSHTNLLTYKSPHIQISSHTNLLKYKSPHMQIPHTISTTVMSPPQKHQHPFTFPTLGCNLHNLTKFFTYALVKVRCAVPSGMHENVSTWGVGV